MKFKPISVFVECDPPTVTKQARNLTSVGVRARSFKSDRLEKVEDYLYKLFSPYAPDELLDGTIGVELIVIFPWPKSTPKKLLQTYGWKCTKPDADNFSKLFLDAINVNKRVGDGKKKWFVEDSRISSLHVSKLYGPITGIQLNIKTLLRLGPTKDNKL